MKKVVYFLLLFTGIVNAQIVNIPDANFKAKLIAQGVDTNADGNIQQTEALAQVTLSVSNATIADLTGIESFTNVVTLYCSNNSLTSINVSSLSQLVFFDCSNNNVLNNLVLPTSSTLQDLRCNHNALTSLNLSGFGQLTYLNCNFNSLTSLILPPTASFTEFRCSNNQLTSLNLSGITAFDLYCNSNQLTTLNTVGATIPNLDCSNNQLTDLNLTGISILSFVCNNNLLTALDLSGCFSITNVTCVNNPLVAIYAKNGRNEVIFWGGMPTLEFICADETQISNLQSQIGAAGVVINSYCTFIPGGDYNTISGTVLFDADANGCGPGDAAFPNIKFNVTDGTLQSASYTNFTGNYNFYTSNSGNYTLTPDIENPSFFTFSPPTASIPFVNNNNNVTTQNFCISANGIHPDLEVVIAPVTTARPGFDATYKVVYKNKGNQVASGDVILGFNDALLDFISATVAPDSQNTGFLNWNYTNLQPFENRSFYVTMNVNSPVEMPAVNIGQQLDFNVVVNPIVGDELPADNEFSFKQIVVGAFDPNEITCLEGATVPTSLIGQYLHYIINFENTGNFEAENVVVRTEINPANFDINTLQMLNTSHNAYIRQTGNIIEFIFQEIALDTGGHGNILLKIKSINNLVDGDTVANRGDIFFDYNAPIDTGMANTTFQSLSSGDFVADNSISVYPNPTNSVVNINGKHNITSVQLYDVQGRLLQTVIESRTQITLDISEKQSGIYFLKITTEAGSKIEKIIKK